MPSRPESSRASTDGDLRIQQWEIWYVYSFYLSRGIPDLLEAAFRMTSYGLIRGFVLPDGRLGWREGETIQLTPPAERDTYLAKDTEISYIGHLPEDLRLPMMKLFAMRSAERNVFGLTAQIPEPSVRVLFPSITVVHPRSGKQLALEATAQIYQPGIVLVSFQSSVDLEIGLDEFIADHVNLNQMSLPQVFMDLGFGELLVRATTAEESSFFRRRAVLKERQAHVRQTQADRRTPSPAARRASSLDLPHLPQPGEGGSRGVWTGPVQQPA